MWKKPISPRCSTWEEWEPTAALAVSSAPFGGGEGWEQGSDDELGRVLARDSAGGHLFGGGVHGQMRDGEHPADRKIRAEESFSLSTFEESLHSSLGHLVHLTNTRCR